MKKMLHLFAGYSYYPEAGLGDYRGSFSCMEDVREAFPRLKNDRINWWIVAGHAEDGSLIVVEEGRG